MPDATVAASPDAGFGRADLTTLCRLDELGLEVTGQRLEPDRAVLACRVVEPDGSDAQWCRRRFASTYGVDLHPLDASVNADRRWLEALIWPEDRDKAALLHDALVLAASVPVSVVAGDAGDVCPAWSARIPAGEPRIVFHCATRMHVPVDRCAAFDRAIDAIASGGPLYRIAIEGDGIQLTEPGGAATRRFDVDGHLAWATPTSADD